MWWLRNTASELRQLETACAGRRVLDLGCGNGSLAVHLLAHGASSVIGVEKEAFVFPQRHPRFDFLGDTTFTAFASRMGDYAWDVAVLSWPINIARVMESSLAILARSSDVCVLGGMSLDSVCGEAPLWRELTGGKWECLTPSSPGTFFLHYRRQPRKTPLCPVEAYALATFAVAPLAPNRKLHERPSP